MAGGSTASLPLICSGTSQPRQLQVVQRNDRRVEKCRRMRSGKFLAFDRYSVNEPHVGQGCSTDLKAAGDAGADSIADGASGAASSAGEWPVSSRSAASTTSRLPCAA